MVTSYHQARGIIADLYAGHCVTSPEGYENAEHFFVPVDHPPALGFDDDCVRLVDKSTGKIIPVHVFPFDDAGKANIERLRAMDTVYDTTSDTEYLDLLKRYHAKYGEDYFAGNPVYGLKEQQIKAGIRQALREQDQG